MGKNATRTLNIVVDGSPTKFVKAMEQANDKVKDTKQEVNALKKSLLTDWDNKTFINAQKAASESVNATEDKVKMLKQTLNQIGDTDTDEAKQQIKYLSVELVKAETSAKQAHKQLENINQLKFDKIANTLGNLGDNLVKSGAVLTAGVTFPLAYVGKQALETASDLVEVQNVVDVSFKDSAQSVNTWSKSLLDSNGISELTAKQNAGLYKSMANGMGVADVAGTEMSKTLTELIGDVASFKNLSFEQVGTKLKSVFTGETESLKDIGVVMTEANVNAFALSHGMEKLSDDMSQADKVALRYAFVVDSLKDAHGDFARTINSTANQSKLAQERFKELSAELAQELLPIATDVLKYANDAMKSFDKLSDSQKKNIVIALGLAAGLGPVVTTLGGIVKGCELSVRTWGKISSAMKAYDDANKVAIASTGALNATMALNPYVLVAAGIALVATAAIAYSSAFENASASTDKLTEALHETIDAYDNSIKSINDQSTTELAELDLTDKLIKRYSELNGKVGITATEREELSGIVKQLSGLLSIEIGIVNMSSAVYDASAESLGKLTQARRKDIEQIAKHDEAIATQKALNALNEQMPELEDNYWKAGEKVESKWSFVWDKKAFEKADKARNEAVEKQKKLQEKLNKLTTVLPEVKPQGTDNKKSIEEQKKEFIKEKELLDYRMSIGSETEQSYYHKLKSLRGKYFSEASADYSTHSDELKTLNREIYNQEVAFTKQRTTNTQTYTKEQTKAYKDMYDSQKTLAKDAYDQNKKLLKSSYDEIKKKLDDDYKDEVSRIDRTLKRKEKSIDIAIKAIDKEIEARKRLKQSEEFDTQIDSLKAQLSYGKMDDFTRREVEAELKRLEEEKSDYAWELAQTDRKAALNEELTDARERAERQKANLQELLEINKTAAEEGYELQIEKLDTTYQMHLTQLETMFDTSSTKMGEISNAFVSTISKGCEEAAKKLSGLISQANSAASKASSVRNYTSTDNSRRSANVNMYGSNYTDAQAQRMVNKALYE